MFSENENTMNSCRVCCSLRRISLNFLWNFRKRINYSWFSCFFNSPLRGDALRSTTRPDKVPKWMSNTIFVTMGWMAGIVRGLFFSSNSWQVGDFKSIVRDRRPRQFKEVRRVRWRAGEIRCTRPGTQIFYLDRGERPLAAERSC